MKPIAEWSHPGRAIGSRVLVYDTVSSTNDFAVGHPPGTAIIARHQSAGRGQYGRTWTSQPGDSLLMSVVVPSNEKLSRPAVLTAWVAVTVAEIVDRMTCRVSRLKWPNDVLVDGKKIAGILIEHGKSTIVGIGLNVNQTEHALVEAKLPRATSIAALAGALADYQSVAVELLTALDESYIAISQGIGLSVLEKAWRDHIGLVGERVTVESAGGLRSRGRLVELSFDGIIIEPIKGAPIRIAPEEVRHLIRK